MTFSKHLKPSDISAQLRMERQRHKGAFLLLEGSHDAKRMRKFVDTEKCSIINCFGKQNVLGSVEIEENNGLGDVLGLADADFDRILGSLQEYDDLVYSRFHDFEVDVCSARVIARYFDEVGDVAKVGSHGGHLGCVEHLLTVLKPLSSMRFANEKHSLGYALQEVEIDIFFDGHRLDIDVMIESVSKGKFTSESHKSTLRQHIDEYGAADLDLWQLTNGHDLVAALGIALRDRFGVRKIPQTWRKEVERHLRLALDREDINEIGLLERVSAWEATNGHAVLK